MNSMPVTHDIKTQTYFDQATPHYNPENFKSGLNFIKQHASRTAKLIDIGCGVGATLELIKNHTPIKALYGLEISRTCLEMTATTVGCHTVLGSILDEDLVQQHEQEFDFCILVAVLHHLIGGNRPQSYSFASTCLTHSIRLLKPGGHLIVFEPTYVPQWLMTLVFWLKKLFSNLTNQRIELFSRWINIGQPVVSYYSRTQLSDMVTRLPNCEVIHHEIVDKTRLAVFIERQSIGLIIRRLK